MTQRQLTFSDYQGMLHRHWVLIVVLALLGGPVGYGVSRVLTSRYTSVTTVLVEPQTISPDIIKPVITGGLTQQLASMKAQILSRSSLQPIIEEFNLYPKDVNRVPPDEMVERLRDSIEVSALKEMDDTKAQGLPGFTISVTLDNPIAARDICGKLTSLFISSAAEARQQASNQTTDFLQQRLDVARGIWMSRAKKSPTSSGSISDRSPKIRLRTPRNSRVSGCSSPPLPRPLQGPSRT